MANAKITLVKSLIGAKPNQKATAASLGLKKVGDVAIQADNEVLGGNVKFISHLVKKEEA